MADRSTEQAQGRPVIVTDAWVRTTPMRGRDSVAHEAQSQAMSPREDEGQVGEEARAGLGMREQDTGHSLREDSKEQHVAECAS